MGPLGSLSHPCHQSCTASGSGSGTADLRRYRHAWPTHCCVVTQDAHSIQNRLARRPMRCRRAGRPSAAATGSSMSVRRTEHGGDRSGRRLRLSSRGGPGASGGSGAGAAQGSAVDDPEQYMTRKPDDSEPFSALAFKVMSDKFVGTLTFCRVYRCPCQTLMPRAAALPAHVSRQIIRCFSHQCSS